MKESKQNYEEENNLYNCMVSNLILLFSPQRHLVQSHLQELI